MNRSLFFFIFLMLSNTIYAKAPHGRIQVIDNRLKKAVPVQGVEIVLNYNGGKKVTYTDSTGSFTFPSNAPKGTFQLKWRYRRSPFFITDGKDIVSIKGSSSRRPWNLTIKDRGEQHYYATVFRAAGAYVRADFVDSHNLFRNIQINAHYRKKFGPGKARYNALTKEVSTWGINKTTDKHYDDIRLFGFITHEMAHVHHDHFFQGRSQHFDTEPRLRESWAEAVKYFLVLEEYKEKKFREFKTYSKQIPFHSGWRNYDWGRSDYYYVYTPLMIDLIDTVNQEEVDDRVSGYTMKQILAVMKDKSCEDFDDLERLLKQRYNNPTEKYLGILFDEMEEH